MYRGSKKILKVPAFDLAWLEVTTGPSPGAVALLPGGGGSTKSGVKNQIQIVSPDEKGLVYTCLEGYLTDTNGAGGSGLCSGVSTGTLTNGVQVICTLIDDKFLLLGVEARGGSSSSASSGSSSSSSSSSGSSKSLLSPSFAFSRLAEVKADFSEGAEATVNCSCILNVSRTECLDTICRRVNYDYVLTGGQDGVVRLWKVTVDDEDDDENPKYTITKVKDLGKHAGAVMSLTFFNDAEMQCAVSSSRDGMIKIWDVSAAKLMADVPFMSDGLSGSGSKASTSAMQCRGAVLARNLDSDGALSLYSIQSGTRGPAHLIRWKVEQNAKDGGDSSPRLSVRR
jgi:WD40 repeat protein